MTAFGPLLRSYRLRAGLGLRTFASLVEQRASTVSAIESGRRAPWRHEQRLRRMAEVLGLVENSDLWQRLLELARQDKQPHEERAMRTEGNLTWWIPTEESPALDRRALSELAAFLGATSPLETGETELSATSDPMLPSLTELAIEWRVRQLLGRRNGQIAPAPVDVEAALESRGEVRLEIVPGLIPRFSVQACAVQSSDGLTLIVDRIVADSQPMATYRHLLARCYAPAALWDFLDDRLLPSDWFVRLMAKPTRNQAERDFERFALAMLLPADPVLAGAEIAFGELVEQRGWVETEEATCAVRNRLAEMFAVPPMVVHRRLVGWPCHLYGRIAQALAAQETTLPPTDWIVDDLQPRQRMLFETTSAR